MKVFHCDNCRNLVFFENVHCGKCQRQVAFLPDAGIMASLTTVDGRLWGTDAAPGSKRYRLCANYTQHNICNWAVPEADGNPLCTSCRLTRVIPDLSVPGNADSWYSMETAKRRLLYSLYNLQLPVYAKTHGRSVNVGNPANAEAGSQHLEPILHRTTRRRHHGARTKGSSLVAICADVPDQ